MDVRMTVETAFNKGEQRTHQLHIIPRLYRITCAEGLALRHEVGKKIVGHIQKAILCDQVEEIIQESCVGPTVAGSCYP